MWVAVLMSFNIRFGGRQVPCMLMAERKASKIEICQQLSSRYKNESEEILQSIMTADKKLAYHYDTEMKHQSMKYHYKTAAAKKNKKN